jgi:hypothetical protein
VSLWTWIAGIGVIILLAGTRGAVRGGIFILLLTLLVARVAYLYVNTP